MSEPTPNAEPLAQIEPGMPKDIRLVARGIIERWPMPPEYRDGVIKKLMQVVLDPASKKREVMSAAKALMAAEQQNQTDQLNELRMPPPPAPDAGANVNVTVNVGVLVGDAIQKALQDPDYLEYRERKLLAADGG